MSYNPYEFDRSIVHEGQYITLGQYTARTFMWMVLGLMITFGTAIVGWLTSATVWVLYTIPYVHLIILIATLVLSFTMASRIENMTVGTAKALFVAFSMLFGFTMSIYLLIYDLVSVIFVFLLTSVYFAALAAYGHFTKRDLSGLRTILFSGLVFLIIFGALSYFIPFLTAFDRIVCMIGIAVFLAYTAYDTQKIKTYYHYYSGYPDMLEKASIFSALQLYLDFLNLFVKLLRLLGRNKK